jgi:hypothetical protein
MEPILWAQDTYTQVASESKHGDETGFHRMCGIFLLSQITITSLWTLLHSVGYLGRIHVLHFTFILKWSLHECKIQVSVYLFIVYQ